MARELDGVTITDEAGTILDLYTKAQKRSPGWIISEALKLYRQRYHLGDKAAPFAASASAEASTSAQQQVLGGNVYNSRVIQKGDTHITAFNDWFSIKKLVLAFRAKMGAININPPNAEGIVTGLSLGIVLCSYIYWMASLS
jgi:hypothetical protein